MFIVADSASLIPWKPKSLFLLDMFNLVSKISLPFSQGHSYWNPINILKHIFFSETTWPIEIKFHLTTPYDWLAKVYTNCKGNMTKMATTPIYGKHSL